MGLPLIGAADASPQALLSCEVTMQAVAAE